MSRVESFAPVVGTQPRILILGSMPGVASLEAVQYYAHPRNAFWPIIGELFSIDATASYPERIRQLQQKPLALWDTLRQCERPGSLDADIRRDSVAPNDIPTLLEEQPSIVAIACNGATSLRYFRKLVLPGIPAARGVELLSLPSTSPANAGMTFAQKRDAWSLLLDFLD